MLKSVRRRRVARKGGVKKRVGYRKRLAKRSSNVRDYAGVSVKQSFTAPGGGTFQPNTPYNLLNVQLNGNDRAVQVAKAYQYYRIKKIAVTFKPLYDTFAGVAGNMTKPNLYFMIDKSGSIPTTVTLEGLKQMGARPRQLDEKNITISWTPSVIESAMFIGGAPATAAPAKYQLAPWLNTNADTANPGAWVASGIDHLGLHWYLDQLISTGYAYTVEVETQFQFKKPLDQFNIGTTSALAAVPAVRNESPDGIVGGGDGV